MPNHLKSLCRNTASPREERIFSEAALRAICTQFAVPKTVLRKPLVSFQPGSRRPRIHLVFGVPCTGKSAISKKLIRECRRGATINLDYDNAILDSHAYMSLQKAMGTGYDGHAITLVTMADKITDYWREMFHAATEAAVAHGYDVIVPILPGPYVDWLGGFISTTATKWDIYAHFTVAPTSYREACLETRLRTKSRIQIVQGPMRRDIFRRTGASINFFLNEYSYMVNVTPHVYFYFTDSDQHCLHTEAVVRFDKRGMRMVVQPGALKR